MQKYFKRLGNLVDRPLFAYATIALLQLKVIWQIWDYKDLTTGDTASYFREAYRWYENFSVNIAWSPLYTVFYGSLLHITTDVYVVTILHRLIIVFAVTMLVLALMRRLLPSGIAWLIAVWWAVLPINFNTLYEVHLFAVIPILIACLLITSSPHPLARGASIAVLLASSFLVRNELLPAVIALVLICIGWDFWLHHISKQKFSIKAYCVNYGLPVLTALTSVCLFYWRSHIKFPELSGVAATKHTLNVCQIYAFGYQQRHLDWSGKASPWTACMELMQRQFGKELPTLTEALKANPSAMIEHFLWNFSLALNGIQVSLFNATSGQVNPDYAPVHLNASWVILPTLLLGFLIITGLFLLYRERKFWWNFWLRERALSWLLLIPISAVSAFVVIPMQRPRPSYLFSLTILLMAIAGMSLFVVTRRLKKIEKASSLIPIFYIFLLLFTPSYFLKNSSERELLGFYRLLRPYQEILASSDTFFMTSNYSFELCSYLGRKEMCTPLTYSNNSISNLQEGAKSFKKQDEPSANMFFADESSLSQIEPNSRSAMFLNNPNAFGWNLIAERNLSPRWMLFQKSGTQVSQINAFPDDLLRKSLTYSGIDQDGWGKSVVSVELLQPIGSSSLVISGLIPLISEPNFATQLRVQVDGRDVANQPLKVGDFHLKIPVAAQGKQHLIKLYFSEQQKLPSPDVRDVAARFKFIGFPNESS